MHAKRLYQRIKGSKERIPVSLNVFFSEVYPAFKEIKRITEISSKKYNNSNFYKAEFYKKISKMP